MWGFANEVTSLLSRQLYQIDMKIITEQLRKNKRIVIYFRR
jgi:hypothetical protein